LAGIDLEVPDVGARIGVERHDRRQEQVVALVRAAVAPRPFEAVAHAEVHEIQFGIVGDGVPYHTAAPFLPPFAAPGFGCHRHSLVLERLGGIARHGVEAPREFAGLGIERRDVAADAVLAAAHADHDASLDHARGLSDREVLLFAGLDAPHRL